VVTRLCINHLRSARARRETYGEALPEPLVGEPGVAESPTPAATSEQNTRQLVARAQRHVEQRRPRFEPSREQRERLARRFFAAARTATSTRSRSCGPRRDLHGAVPPQPLKGRVRVARTLLAGMRPASAASRCPRSR
jgi:hypothetical protein